MLSHEVEPASDQPVEIRRYPNRKLYASGGYVTLERVGVLLREGRSVTVRETRSGRDVTAYTLAQLIAQESERGTPVYDAAALGAAIRGATVPPAVSRVNRRKTRQRQAA